MINLRFGELKRLKALRDGRDLSLRIIATETGLALNTIQRLNKNEGERVYLSTLNVLCNYFGVEEVSEILEYRPDPPGAALKEGEKATA